MCYEEAKNTNKCLNSPQFLLELFYQHFENEDEINLCDDARIDAIFILTDGTTYVFRGTIFVFVFLLHIKADFQKVTRKGLNPHKVKQFNLKKKETSYPQFH